MLVLLVGICFGSVLGHDFVGYDDNGYVSENAWVQRGLTWSNVGHAFRTTEIAYWHPLTWLSHLLDVELFGLHPAGHHLTSLLWHAANTVLLFLVMRRLTGAGGRSWMVAAFFGLHPLHVESVAWVAERKDVLSTFFLLLTIWFYTAWQKRREGGGPGASCTYWAAWSSLALGLMAKPMLVTLPCLLLLLDYWPLRRWQSGSVSTLGRQALHLVIEKLPFFALSAAASVAAVRAQAALGTVQSTERYSLATRLLNALVAYVQYLEKCFWPTKLAFFYPYPRSHSIWAGLLAGLLLVAVSVVSLRWARQRPFLLVGWLWFLGLLVPVIGLVQVGGQAMADRYTYVSIVGIFVMVCWAAADWAQRSLGRQNSLRIVAGLCLLGCAVLTVRQVARWRDSLTLFSHALEVTADNWCAHYCLGCFYAKTPETWPQSIAEYREVVRLTPAAPEAHFALAAMLARDAATKAEAVAEFESALRLNPKHIQARIGLGQVLIRQPGRIRDAIHQLELALSDDPGNPLAQSTLARAKLSLAAALAREAAHWAEAVELCRAAIRLQPGDPDARLQLADCLALRPEGAEAAIGAYREVMRLRPDWPEVRNNLGIVLAQMPGRLPEAIAEYRALVAVKPAFVDAHANLANALARLPDQAAEAIQEYETALRLQPDDFRVQFNYGQFLLAFPEQRARAIAHLENALRLQPDLAPARELLARWRETNP